MSGVSLTASGLRVRRGGRGILDGLDLIARPGERLAVVGPSGAGKTTLLGVLAGLEVPESGTVRLGDVTVGTDWRLRARIGLIPQVLGLVPLLTAAENVELALQAARRPRAAARLAAEDALAVVGLVRRTGHLVEELSGGEQQRVAVARALALSPDVVLADEPTTQLDAENRARVLDALSRAAGAGAVVIVTTHDPEVAERCERVLHLHAGRLDSDEPVPSRAGGPARPA